MAWTRLSAQAAATFGQPHIRATTLRIKSRLQQRNPIGGFTRPTRLISGDIVRRAEAAFAHFVVVVQGLAFIRFSLSTGHAKGLVFKRAVDAKIPNRIKPQSVPICATRTAHAPTPLLPAIRRSISADPYPGVVPRVFVAPTALVPAVPERGKPPWRWRLTTLPSWLTRLHPRTAAFEALPMIRTRSAASDSMSIEPVRSRAAHPGHRLSMT